jgi:hypothetical protein
MNSYISPKLEAEGGKELQRLFQAAPGSEKSDQSLDRPLSVARKQRQKRSVQSRTLSPSQALGYYTGRAGLVAQGRNASIEAVIWVAGCVLAILGLVNAAYSEQPLLWLAIWPAPIVLVSTIFIFFSQGFHFRDGVLILGRRRN